MKFTIGEKICINRDTFPYQLLYAYKFLPQPVGYIITSEKNERGDILYEVNWVKNSFGKHKSSSFINKEYLLTYTKEAAGQ